MLLLCFSFQFHSITTENPYLHSPRQMKRHHSGTLKEVNDQESRELSVIRKTSIYPWTDDLYDVLHSVVSLMPMWVLSLTAILFDFANDPFDPELMERVLRRSSIYYNYPRFYNVQFFQKMIAGRWGIGSFPVQAIQYLLACPEDEQIYIHREKNTATFFQGTPDRWLSLDVANSRFHAPCIGSRFILKSTEIDQPLFGLPKSYWTETSFTSAGELLQLTHHDSKLWRSFDSAELPWDRLIDDGLKPSTIILIRLIHYAIKFAKLPCRRIGCLGTFPATDIIGRDKTYTNEWLYICKNCRDIPLKCRICSKLIGPGELIHSDYNCRKWSTNRCYICFDCALKTQTRCTHDSVNRPDITYHIDFLDFSALP